MSTTISRRRFIATAGATALSAPAATRVLRAAPVRDNIHLGMALQASKAADLQEQAKRIAAVGFDTVQLTFFFHPTADELKGLSETLAKLNLRVAAFGTYFNLFRPDDMRFMNSSQASMKLIAAHADLFDCRQFVTWSGSYAAQFAGADPRNHSVEAVVQLQKAIREVLLPIIGPINGRVALEPYYPHLVGRIELAKGPRKNNLINYGEAECCSSIRRGRVLAAV
jgi:sugar phosphate isomerase/epimerase